MYIRTREEFTKDSKQKLDVAIIDGEYLNIVVSDVDNDITELCSKTISLKEFFTPYSSFAIFFSEDMRNLTNPIKITYNYNMQNLILDVNNASNVPVLYIYFHNSVDNGLIICMLPTNDIELCSTLFRNTNEILYLFPDFKTKFEQINKKREVIMNLDCNESLSGLEPQVDYLTMILKDIIFDNEDIKNKLIKKYPNLDIFFNVCDTGNVLNIKPENSMFNEIKKQKELIRQKQTEYYEVKNG